MGRIRKRTLADRCSSVTGSATFDDKLRHGRSARILTGVDDQLFADHPLATPLLCLDLLPGHVGARRGRGVRAAADLSFDRDVAGPIAGLADESRRITDQR